MLVKPTTLLDLCRARDLLCEAGGDALSIEDIAGAVAISSSHFTRQFEAVFGRTPSARAGLSESDGPVAGGRVSQFSRSLSRARRA